ncbi:MAG: rRNA maturation RNase YbeY [Anaerolineae bacterium]|nr:rRNA maturation RNase YbeY [Anaerolineae bacterium]
MSVIVDVQNDDQYPLDDERLVAAATAAVARVRPSTEAALSVVITDNDAVAGLNHQYRDIDAPTDVLSFPADAPPVVSPDEPPYLGDLVIAYPYAAEQARRENHDLSDSLALLVVHGTLHLLGFDHDTSANRAAMWQVQGEVLEALNISAAIVPALEGYLQDETTDSEIH